MAAGAGSLGIALGGPAVYDGAAEARPVLGRGREPEVADMRRAAALVRRGLVLWVVVILIGGWLLA